MITVITATHNAARTLPALIKSLRAQTDRRFEWFVIDGASTDGTVELVVAASDVVSRWVSEPDFGIYDALNKALRWTESTYYLVVGADDDLDPHAIERYRHAAEQSQADIVTGAIMIENAIRRPPPPGGRGLRSGPPLVSGHSVGALIKRSLHDEIGLYSRRFPIAADTFFLLQAERLGKRVTRIDDVIGTFASDGVSGRDLLGGLCESFRANAEVRGRVLWHALLFLARIVRNYRRIAGQFALRFP